MAHSQAHPELRTLLYTTGYYASAIEDGKRPVHGYPQNHLPTPATKEMDTKPVYASLLKKAK
jgi:hypothetical protein